ncbi:MAG: serine hydrolase [Bacteroidetes bacterium]|nr:serine hydrolase [Bacteroidota bacterium]
MKNIKQYLFSISLALLSITHIAFGQSIDYKKAADAINLLADSNKFSGVILIAEKGEVKFKKAAGFINYAEQKKLTTTSIFELASVSKQFTAMTIMMLKEKGLLNYDDLVEKYISIPYKGITIRQLLTHTSGLPDYQAMMDAHWDKSKIAGNEDIISYLNSYAPPKLFEPGTQYLYSNTGYVLLASITEKVSGRDFVEFCTTEIFHKIKMRSTAIRTLGEKAAIANFALGHVFVPERNAYIRADSFPSSNYTIWLGNRKGPGRISSTVDDLLKWDQALYTNKLISQTTLAAAFTPMPLSNGTISNYGFGWELRPKENIVWHNGDNPGYKTIIIRFLDNRATLIILCNNASEDFENFTANLKKIILN